MADNQLHAILRQGVKAWNVYRNRNPGTYIDLRVVSLPKAYLPGVYLKGALLLEADLSGSFLQGACLSGADLRGGKFVRANLNRADLRIADLRVADLTEAQLQGADLSYATLRGTDLTRADLSRADLTGVDLTGADLRGADLTRTNLTRTDLSRADLTGAHLHGTIFANSRLRQTHGLDACLHHGPSTLDLNTLRLSWLLPLAFLQGCGLEDGFIEQIPLLVRGIKPSCLISFALDTGELARRLYTDLQAEGIRCWFAPADIKSEGKLHTDTLRGLDKLLLIFSKTSIPMSWTESEVRAVIEAEAQRRESMIIPICVDPAPKKASQGWLVALPQERLIRCFCNWNEPGTYRRAFKGLVQELLADV